LLCVVCVKNRKQNKKAKWMQIHAVIVRYGTVSVYTHGKADNSSIYIVRYGTVSGNTHGKADNIKAFFLKK
jgi:hypothetical protein